MLPRAARLPGLFVVLFLIGLAALVPVLAQDRPDNSRLVITAAQYAQAEKFLGPAVTTLVVGGSVSPSWLPDERFTYRRVITDGAEFLLVDPVK